MILFINCLLAGLLAGFLYRNVRHKSIFPNSSLENPYVAWSKIIVVSFFTFSVLWVLMTLLQSFPD